MVFGNPYHFAVWVEYLPVWGEEFKNGLFSLMVNGSSYPNDIQTATLSTDLFEILDTDCALISHPENESIFNMPTKDAYNFLMQLAHPEPTNENEYPDQIFEYCVLSSNVSSFGGRFFAVAWKDDLRIIGGKFECLIDVPGEDRRVWKEIEDPLIEDVIIPKCEINKIMNDLKIYTYSIFKSNSSYP